MQVTVGLPVYNGAKRGLRRALEGLLAQTYGDFVLVVSDNASTDETRDIVLSYQKTDKRILWLPNTINVGAIENFKRCSCIASSPFFMWAADDDSHEPTYIQKCLDAMESDVALAYTQVEQDGRITENIPLDQDQAAFRFLKCFSELSTCFPFYGLWRTQVVKMLNWKDLLWGFDFVALCEASLAGKLKMVPEVLFKTGSSLTALPSYTDVLKSYVVRMDTRKSSKDHDGRGLTLPIVEKIMACFEVLQSSRLPAGEKEQLIPMMLLAAQRYRPYLQEEVTRMRSKVAEGQLADGWLLKNEIGPAGRQYHARKLLQRLEDAEFLGLDVKDVLETCRSLAR